jgi:hypothetical protein
VADIVIELAELVRRFVHDARAGINFILTVCPHAGIAHI